MKSHNFLWQKTTVIPILQTVKTKWKELITLLRTEVRLGCQAFLISSGGYAASMDQALRQPS